MESSSVHMPRVAVLVVEHDPMQMWEVMDLAEEADLEAFGTASAAEAIMLMDLHPQIRILVVDVDLAEPTDGLALSWAASERRAPPTIILTSGGIEAISTKGPPGSTVFAKPIRPAALIRAFRTACETPA